MTKITIIRHAEAEGNLYRRVHGWFDSMITPTGRHQIRRLEERFRKEIAEGNPIDVLYASDLNRTMQTAGAVARAAGIPIHPCKGLREINSGNWEDLPWGHCSREYPDLLRDYAAYPDWRIEGGESTQDLYDRTSAALDEILIKHPNQSICIVSHSVAIRALLCRIYGLSPSDFLSTPAVANASVSVFEYDGTSFRERYVGDTSHIADIVQLKARHINRISSGTQLWYRAADPVRDLPLAVQFWRDSWLAVHGNLMLFDHEAVAAEISRILRNNRDSVCFGMLDDKEIGILIMDSTDLTEDDCGHITLFAIAPEFRGHHYAVQLLGQAVSFYRKLGRNYLKLRVAPENKTAISFYKKNDFVDCGFCTGPNSSLLLMKKAI